MELESAKAKLAAANKSLDVKSVYLKQHQLLMFPAMCRRSQKTSMSSHRRIIIDFWEQKKKAVIRVRFPDNYTLEATFHPSETIQSLLDLRMKVIAHPELPYYIYTPPPKKQIKDVSRNFYCAEFIPGAIVYFSYHLPKGDDGAAASGSYLEEEVISLQGLDSMIWNLVNLAEMNLQNPPTPVRVIVIIYSNDL